MGGATNAIVHSANTRLTDTARRIDPSKPRPGIKKKPAKYRRWFTFGLVLEPRRRVRLHTTYLSGLALARHGRWTEDKEKSGVTTRYFLHYILHTGALWHGVIGRGEIFVYDRGELRLLRRFARLEPTTKDDLSVELDFKSIHWSKNWWETGFKGARHIRWHDWLRLPSASGQLASKRVDTHVGLIVDGDPKTQWVSPRGKALSSFVQLPSNHRRRLTRLEVVSGKPCARCVRPSRLELGCVTKRGTGPLKRVDLPNTAGPHLVPLPKRSRCNAIRLRIAGVHGDKRASVAIAEVVQRFAKPRRKKLKRAKRPRAPGASVKSRGPRKDPLAFDVVNLEHVRWSPDGAVLHYRLQLENIRPAGGLRLGYFVDVATGKVLSTYRLDRAGVGKLPEPYASAWARALPYEKGEARLRRDGFRPAVGARLAPSAAGRKGQSLRLRGRIKGRTAALSIQATDRGYRWSIASSRRSKASIADTVLELLHNSPRQKERLLARRRGRIDLRFAAQHAKVRRARRPYFKTLVKVFRDQWASDSQHYIDNLPAHIWKRMPGLWQALTYPHREAYGGRLQLFWEPQGRAVAALWLDRKDLSSHQPVEKLSVFAKQPDGKLDVRGNYDQYISNCARDLRVMVCPWDRRGDPRHRVGVTVHALQTSPRAAGPAGMKGPGPKRAKPKSPNPVRTPKSGCGCAAAPRSVSGTASVLFLLLLWGWRRRSSRFRIGTSVSAIALSALALVLAGAPARAKVAVAPPIRLAQFTNLPLPAGGRIYGPHSMRRMMVLVHYPQKHKLVIKQLRQVLLADKWVIAKTATPTATMFGSAEYLQLWVRKGRQRARLVVTWQAAQNSEYTVLFITREK